MRWICRYRSLGLIGLTVLAATILSACGGSSDTEFPSHEEERQDFLSRILPSGDSPDEWNYIWGCDVLSQTGTDIYRGVPLRFYRPGRMIAGIGTSEVYGTWRLDNIQMGWTIASILMTLDEAAPDLFGTNSKKLLIDLHRNFDRYSYNYLKSTGSNRLAKDDTVEISLTCVRYNEAGDVVGELPDELQEFEETPTFITTGEASIERVPTTASSSDDEAETSPTQDEPTSEPVDSPSANPDTTTTQPSSDAPLADVNAQVKDIWYTGDFVDTVDGVRQRFGSVIQFNNGEVSRDGETISNEGIAASKRKNPEHWGVGRVSSSGLLSYKWSTSRSWLEPYLSAPTRSYPRNQRIRGCFENSTGVKGLGSSPLITRLCLSENSGFTLDDAGNNTGNYLIEDHAIRLNFSSGERAEFLFGGYYTDGFIYRLIIGDRLFYVSQ